MKRKKVISINGLIFMIVCQYKHPRQAMITVDATTSVPLMKECLTTGYYATLNIKPMQSGYYAPPTHCYVKILGVCSIMCKFQLSNTLTLWSPKRGFIHVILIYDDKCFGCLTAPNKKKTFAND